MSEPFTLVDAAVITVKATVLLGAALALQPILRRRASAATRHAILALAVASVLLLPTMSLVAPRWGVMPRDASISAQGNDVRAADVASAFPTRAETAAQASAPPRLSSASESLAANKPTVSAPSSSTAGKVGAMLLPAYFAGLCVVLLYLVVQWTLARRFVRTAAVVDDQSWLHLLVTCSARMGVDRSVQLRRSRDENVPFAIGTRRPAIVIPAIADTWDDDRREAVILHELAHVARYDCLTAVVASVSCALYWFNPAIWWVARQLRTERELACDDRVIAAGTVGRDYAGHLLEIAYSATGRSFALAVGMARRSQLEGRLLAALDDTRNRRVPAVRARATTAALAAVMLVAISGARPTVAAPPDKATPAPSVADVATTAEAQQSIPILDAVDRHLDRLASHVVRAATKVVQNLQDGTPGTWEIRPTGTPGVVQLRLVEVNSSSGSNVPVAQLDGLTQAQLSGPGGPVQFRIRRDAGTFTFEGVLRNGVGAGTFSFAADATFPAELAKRGFARPTAREQYQLARYDIGFAYIDELTRQGYSKPQTSDLVQAAEHGVHLTYLREMGALGYRLGTLQPLITLRDHGVSPDYVRQLAELGYKNLSADEVRNARDHGVTAEYVRAMRDAGYGSLPLDKVTNARDHGVTAEYLRALDEAGYRKMPLDDVIRVRDHGVSPEYIRDMHQLGFKLPVDELVRARDHGVSVEYVRAIAGLGYGNQPLDTLIRLRDHGVTPEYAKDIKSLGYDGLTLDDLISLRDHGVTVERIKAANARAGTRLPIDMLRSLVSGGMR